MLVNVEEVVKSFENYIWQNIENIGIKKNGYRMLNVHIQDSHSL